MESITLSCHVLYLFRFILAAVTTLLVVMAVLFCKIFIIIVLPVFIFVYFFYLPRFVKGYKLCFNGRLCISRGVFIKKESIFENRQLLHFRTIQTPICRLFGCKYVLIFAPRMRCLIVLDNASAEKILGDIYEKT